MKEKLEKLLKEIKDIDITYDYVEAYNNLYGACIDFGSYTGCWEFDVLFEDIINYDIAEERAKHELKNNGLLRLYYFMGDCNFHNEIFRVNAYGNLEDIHKEDLEQLKQDIIEKIEELIENEV